MDYLEFKINCLEEFREILIAELSEIGFDSFLETEEGIEVYAPSDSFDRDAFQAVIQEYSEVAKIKVAEGQVAKVNWNEEWEKNYDPIAVGDLVYVRASFHPSQEGFQHEIVINPKMSFGTGHHATTFQMLKLQGDINHKSKRVLDVGSGTGILAIMAHLLGAKEVEAFDIDDWCVENGNENFALNGLKAEMGLGTIREVKLSGQFDIVLANINKNVLLDELVVYSSLVKPKGFLLLSGFYTHDIEDLMEVAKPLGFTMEKSSEKNQWAALKLRKD